MNNKLRSIAARHFPEQLKQLVYRGENIYWQYRYMASPVLHKSRTNNVLHCCVQRTATQWMKRILSDSRVYRYSGLRLFNTRVRGVSTKSYRERTYKPFPDSTIVSTLWISYENMVRLRENSNGIQRAFFVMRDPRDITVSHYFSSKFSHTLMGDMSARREKLKQLSVEDGLILTIDYLSDYGLYDALRSWNGVDRYDDQTFIARYEDLFGDEQLQVFCRLCEHCDIALPPAVLKSLLEDYSFEHISGRRPGTVNLLSHYRKGKAGDWRKHFSTEVIDYFRHSTSDLVESLGYVW